MTAPLSVDRHSPPPTAPAAELATAAPAAQPGTAAPAAQPGSAAPTLLPVRRGDRTIGAYVLREGRVCYRPAVDPDRVLAAVVAVATVAATATAVAVAVTGRRAPAVHTVTMGPGGWVSFKGVGAPPLRPADQPRPWWAKLLRARRLVVQR